jgi:hypothetical protein
MKANLKKLIGTAVLGLAMFSSSIQAWAGQKYLPEVTIGTYSASGSMAGARFSGDNKQYIGCSFETLAGPFVTCFAQDKTGKSFSCSSSSSKWAPVVKAITDSSVIYFETLNNGGSCSTLIVENSSSHLR